jgi:asparagine synthase (glutamine-hydrolysing)
LTAIAPACGGRSANKSRPQWVDQLVSRPSLEATGYFDVDCVLRERARQVGYPRVTPRRIIMDLSLTCVVATELWHHIHMGGGLCDLPTWSQTPLHQATSSSLDVLTPVETSLVPRG